MDLREGRSRGPPSEADTRGEGAAEGSAACTEEAGSARAGHHQGAAAGRRAESSGPRVRGGRVEISAERTEEGGSAIRVRDTGVGIPATDLGRVFERFYRADRSRSREVGGSGLGLAIVKHLAIAHGGDVAVDSQQSRGSTFTVLLPGRQSRP